MPRQQTSITEIVGALGPWHEGKGPLYHKLSAGLLRLLEQGRIETGSSLPPERALAQALAVSRNTVSAAYAELRASGWLEARQGSATTVSATKFSPVGAHRANAFFSTLLKQYPAALDLTIAVPDAAPIVREVVTNFGAETANSFDPTEDHGYHPRGHPQLRHLLAANLTRNGLATAEDDLLITTGAQQAISLVVSSLTRPGDAVGVEEVSFPGALDAVAYAGAHPIPLRHGPDGLDVEAVESSIRQHRPRLLYLIPTFHNPTGSLLGELERKRLAAVIADSGTTTIDDLTLADLDFGQPAPPPLAAVEPEAPVISVGSLSKVFWGGLRIGWVRANPTVIKYLAGVKATADLGSSAISQAMAAALLNHYAATRQWRNARLTESLEACTGALADLLPEWRWKRPAGGPHLWVELPATDAMAFSQLLIRNGVAVVAGPLLAATEGVATRHIRIPLYKSPEELDKAVDIMAAVWRRRPASLD
ncbi:MAG: PLP-dependent aminotransferase family protein [Acidimicrobiia bacterium]